MSNLIRSSLLLAVLTAALPAAAQTQDVAPAPAVGGPRVGIPVVAPAGGGAKAVLHDNGTYVTQTGVGFGGADVSEIESGLTLFGWGHQFTLLNRIADDFNVPAATTWTLSNLRWLAYQTGAPTTGTITGIYTEYVAGADPNGAVLAGDQTTNRLNSATWTGVYRVTSSTLTNNQRALIEVNANAAFVPALAAGQYWVLVMCDGTLTSGPWAAVTVPWDAADNNQQSIGGGAFAATTQGQGGAPGDSVYWLDGSSSSAGATQYCIAGQKINSCGVVAVTAGPAASTGVLSAGPGSYTVTSGVVPGGPLPGIAVYNATTPLVTPINLAFGLLCVQPGPGFFRLLPPVFAPPGCSASYSFDFGAYLATQMADARITPAGLVLLGPATCQLQSWYRDPALPSTAAFGSAIQFTVNLGASAPPPPIVTGFSPSAGGEGTVVTVTGANFGGSAADLKVLMANGVGFADVTSVAVGSLSSTVFAVGQTGLGPITVLRGTRVVLPDGALNLSGINSTSSQIRTIPAASGTNSVGNFNLTPLSNNAVGASSGTPLPGSITLPLGSLTPGTTAVVVQVAVKLAGGDFRTFELRIDFSGVPSAPQIADHMAAYITSNFGAQGLSATAAGSTVNARVSLAGATYAGAVVKGI